MSKIKSDGLTQYESGPDWIEQGLTSPPTQYRSGPDWINPSILIFDISGNATQSGSNIMIGVAYKVKSVTSTTLMNRDLHNATWPPSCRFRFG